MNKEYIELLEQAMESEAKDGLLACVIKGDKKGQGMTDAIKIQKDLFTCILRINQGIADDNDLEQKVIDFMIIVDKMRVIVGLVNEDFIIQEDKRLLVFALNIPGNSYSEKVKYIVSHLPRHTVMNSICLDINCLAFATLQICQCNSVSKNYDEKKHEELKRCLMGAIVSIDQIIEMFDLPIADMEFKKMEKLRTEKGQEI